MLSLYLFISKNRRWQGRWTQITVLSFANHSVSYSTMQMQKTKNLLLQERKQWPNSVLGRLSDPMLNVPTSLSILVGPSAYQLCSTQPPWARRVKATHTQQSDSPPWSPKSSFPVPQGNSCDQSLPYEQLYHDDADFSNIPAFYLLLHWFTARLNDYQATRATYRPRELAKSRNLTARVKKNFPDPLIPHG